MFSKVLLYLRSLYRFYLYLFIFVLLLSLLNYFDIINYKVFSIISFIFMILLFIYLGFYRACRSDKKGYINGLIIGLINVLLLFLVSVILGEPIKASMGIYFLILLLSSMIGGMFGVNAKNKTISN